MAAFTTLFTDLPFEVVERVSFFLDSNSLVAFSGVSPETRVCVLNATFHEERKRMGLLMEVAMTKSPSMAAQWGELRDRAMNSKEGTLVELLKRQLGFAQEAKEILVAMPQAEFDSVSEEWNRVPRFFESLIPSALEEKERRFRAPIQWMLQATQIGRVPEYLLMQAVNLETFSQSLENAHYLEQFFFAFTEMSGGAHPNVPHSAEGALLIFKTAVEMALAIPDGAEKSNALMSLRALREHDFIHEEG